MKALLAGVAVFALSAGGASYFFSAQQPKDSLPGLFCSQMADEQAYKDKRVQTYATLIPGKDGWIFRTRNDFRMDWKIQDETLENLMDLQQAMRAHNAELVIVMPPVRGMIHTNKLTSADQKKYQLDQPQKIWDAYESFISEMQNSGVNMVGLNRSEVNERFFYSRNHHWSADGARVTAQKTSQAVKNMPQYTDIPKINFVSQPEEEKTYKSSYSGAFQKICGTDVPPEVAQNYVTVPEDSANNEQTLFDDDATPQVVLVGTSNSVNESSQANFDGFLKESLSTDVLNLAIAGAGIDTSLIAYLNSAHYKNDTPKIVIWEIPGYYNLDVMNDKVFKQAIPAAYGACGEDAVASGDFKAIANNSPLYASIEGNSYGPYPTSQDPRQKALGSNNNLYLHLAFIKPMKQEFAVKFHYKDGKQGETKIVKFKRSKRYPADGDFYTLFPQASKQSELNKIRLTLPGNMHSTDVSMEVCSLPRAKPSAPEDESM